MDKVINNTKTLKISRKKTKCLKSTSKDKKTTKSKANEKLVLKMMPKLRLEPRLTPNISKNKEKECKNVSENYLNAKLKDVKIVLPRVKFEPDLSPSCSSRFEENLFKNVTEDNSETNEIDENSSLAITPCDESCIETENNYGGGTSYVWSNSSAIENTLNSKAPSENAHCSNYTEDNAGSENFALKKDDAGRKNSAVKKQWKVRKVRGSAHWNDKELMQLVDGLQSEGFSDLKKVAEYIKTKNEDDINWYIDNGASKHITIKDKNFIDFENFESPRGITTANGKVLLTFGKGTLQIVAEVNDKKQFKKRKDVCHFIKRRRLECRASKNAYRGRPVNQWSSLKREVVSSWPNVRKWRKIAYNQMLPSLRTKEYSEVVIPALCKKFYEEEKEPADPQVINVKLIYKYMMSCMSGEIPPQLPTKESALVLDMLREVRSIPIAYDFEEEIKFMKEFKEAIKFKPFQVKDEFKKKTEERKDDHVDRFPNAVPVPEQVFMDLSRHRKVVQSFNPMVIPVWMLQKEQEILDAHFHGSSSNVHSG